MSQISLRLIVAIFGFALGVLSHHAVDRFIQLRPPIARIDSITLPSETFKDTGIISGFKEFYVRESDGANVRYGCWNRSSPSAALRLVRWQDAARVVESTDILDNQGDKIGERVVSTSVAEVFGAEIEWNEGARLFSIQADSLADARMFEISKVWRGGGCWDFRSLKNQ